MKTQPWTRFPHHKLFILFGIPSTSAFLHSFSGFRTPSRLGSRASSGETWSIYTKGNPLSTLSRCSDEQGLPPARWCGRSRRTRNFTVLRGKKRKKGKGGVAGGSSSWYDDDETVEVSDDTPRAETSTVSMGPFTPPPIEGGTSAAGAVSITDDDPLPHTEEEGSAGLFEEDGGGNIVLDPVWVDGETEGETPIVEKYGLNVALGATDDMIDNGLPYDSPTSSASASSVSDFVERGNGLIEDVSAEGIWTGGMEYPEDYVDSEGRVMRRDFDDMLMERSIRFYDPKVTGERERCYLVGLEASGWNAGGAKNTQSAFPQRRMNTKRQGLGGEVNADDLEGDDEWDEEKEADYQMRKQKAYEVRKEEREMRFSLEESMAELSELAGTAGLEVCGSTYQRVNEPNPRTYIGTGKVKEIKSAMNQLGVCTVIFDDELSPGQQRNLEVEFGGEAAGIKVLDRTALILDIFAQHARTREGQLQVELALHMYRLPRLTKLWTHLERQQGGVGLRGPGERQLEVDRRLLKDKIIALKKELSGVRRHRDLQRRSREKLGLPVVALVGYTNAGKSTLLNTLTRAGVMAENMLFATLDPTTRKVKLAGLKVHSEVMLTDTVGFIQKLPTNLVAAFRATLEEVVEADVIVHIVDASSSSREKQESAVVHVLSEMGVVDKPRITLWNKLDLLPEEEREDMKAKAKGTEGLIVSASAKTGEGLDDLVACLEEVICSLLFKVEAVVPYSRGDLLSRVHELGACDSEEFTDAGTFIKARVPRELVNRLKPFFTKEFNEQFEVDEMAEMGEEEAAAKEEENNWKLLAKKRTKASAANEAML